MTSDEHRDEIIHAMADAIWRDDHGYDGGLAQAQAALDTLPKFGVFAGPIVATDKMITAAKSAYPMTSSDARRVWEAMRQAGSLTNGPELKP